MFAQLLLLLSNLVTYNPLLPIISLGLMASGKLGKRTTYFASLRKAPGGRLLFGVDLEVAMQACPERDVFALMFLCGELLTVSCSTTAHISLIHF